ncbi:MAG: hypothetical protein KDB25_07895, partial [Leucobacter sp.]|nr:hypothetical protein [Leucobacter sp.]
MATDINSIITACGSQPVCLYDGASIANASDLQAALPVGVQVAVIPEPDQAQSVSSLSIAEALKQHSGADTVIVIEDRPTKDRFAVASDGDAAGISASLYGQNAADGGDAVTAVASTLASPSTPDGPGSGTSGAPVDGGFVALAIGFALLGLAAVTLVITLGARARKKSRALGSPHALEKQLAAALQGEDGEFVRKAIDDLQDRGAAVSANGTDAGLGARIQSLVNHLSELFTRVRTRGTDQQLRLLTAQYRDTLTKLTKAVADDYYGDISRNPQFWSNPEERLHEVHLAVESVDQQAVENIRQVNESRDLEF